MHSKALIQTAIVLFALAFPPRNSFSGALPEKARVLTIDLQNHRLQSVGADETSAQLQQLLQKSKPDLVCVQGALDWENCEQLAKLSSGMRVLTCSAFTADAGKPRPAQVAILARERASLSWVQELPAGRAFAFAIVQAGARKLGVFSLQNFPTQSPVGDDLGARVQSEIKKAGQFPQNRPDAFVVAGPGLSNTNLLLEAGFEMIPADVPPTLKSSVGFRLVGAGFLSRPRILAIPRIASGAALCDLDAAGAGSTKFAYQTTLLMPGETPAEVQAMLHPPAPKAAVAVAGQRNPWPWVAAGVVVLFLLLVTRKKKSGPSAELVALREGSGELGAAGGAQNEAVRSNLLSWMKTQFVQRLLMQRESFITTQAEATRRTLVIEEKLSQLQNALQARISGYETRIQRLENELSAATTENRDLIQSQIELLKEKLAKAREEHSYRRN
jgi:hypothetical protein